MCSLQNATSPPRPLKDRDRARLSRRAQQAARVRRWRSFYNRPAIVDLAGDVSGRRILDAGCGSGPILADLRAGGADITGIDASAGMLEQARLRLGTEPDLLVADLADRLPFDDDTFDDIVASQVLHYLEDWTPTLAEFRRVLKPGGRLIVSEEHPAATFLGDRLSGGTSEYFGVRARTE